MSGSIFTERLVRIKAEASGALLRLNSNCTSPRVLPASKHINDANNPHFSKEASNVDPSASPSVFNYSPPKLTMLPKIISLPHATSDDVPHTHRFPSRSDASREAKVSQISKPKPVVAPFLTRTAN